MSKLKLLSLFSGIGAFEKALTNLNIDYELIGFSEIDEYAIESYCAIHNIDKKSNLGDVSQVEVEDIPDFDLMTYGFPCQDISIAGRQQGLSKRSGTRSSLLWEAMRIAKYKKPKYLIAENVKNLVGRKFKSDFEKWIKELNQLGYNTYYTILNAKNHGIPQNRERVFVVSIRKDIDDGTFSFPEPINLNKSLWDFLETDINEEYYVNEYFLNQIRNTKFRKDKYIESTRKVVNKEYNESLIMDYRYDEGLRIRKNNLCPTLTTKGKSSISGVALIYRPDDRLRFITPLECWRLMGFTDEDFYKAKASLNETFYKGRDKSDSQLYKQAGNSIVVNVLEHIFRNLFKSKIY